MVFGRSCYVAGRAPASRIHAPSPRDHGPLGSDNYAASARGSRELLLSSPWAKDFLTSLRQRRFAQMQHVGDGGTVGSIGWGLPIDTLVTPRAAPIRSILIQIPLQLLDSGDANVIEQLPA